MCTRYVFTTPADMIRDVFAVSDPLPASNFAPSYNVAPRHIMPIVRPSKTGREIALASWGLIPFFSKDGTFNFSTFNARSEELRDKATYKGPFKSKRCIVPATGYIEFTGPKGNKLAHLFTRVDGQPIALGGLWERWRSADKSETKETFTVVTTAPNGFAGQFHDRMPLVLDLDQVDAWLGAEPDDAAGLMKPAKEGILQERPLGKAINNIKNNSPELLAEIST